MEVGLGKTFTLKGLAPGATYVVEVQSIPKKGKPSPWSRPVKFRTNTKDVAPPPITNLVVSFDGAGFTASWDGSAALAEKDFAFFKITLTSPDFPAITKIYASQSQSFSLDYDSMLFAFGGIANPIVIEVKSIDRSGNESTGVSATGGNAPPAAPQNVSVVAETMGYRVSWDTPEETDYSYTKIYESSTVSGTYTAIENVTATPSSIKVVGYSTRYVKVSHVDTFGGESELAPAVGIAVTPINPVTVDTTPPDQRTAISYTAGVGQATVSWTNPTDPTNNSDVAGVTIRYARISSPSNYTWVDVPFTFDAPVTTATITGLLPLSGYNFSISTYDKTQNRTAYSTSTQVTTLADTTPPPRPVAPVVAAGLTAGGPMMVRVTQSAIEHGTTTPLPLDTYYFKVFMLNSGVSTAPSPGTATNTNATEIGLLFAAYNGGDAQEKFYVPLEEGEQRYFYTRAVDTSGNISDASLSYQSEAMVIFSNAYISDLSADKITAGRLNANEYIQVGTTSDQITIKSTGTLGQIYSGTGTYNNTNTGIYIDTAGQFSLKNRLSFDGTNLSLQGNITATGGSFTGNVQLNGGSLYAGANPSSGARLIMNQSGLTAYNTSGTSTFTLDAATGAVSLSGYLQVGGAASDVNAYGTTISGDKIRTGSIESVGYVAPSVGSNFAQTGTKFDLSSAEIRSTNFYISGGSAGFLGEVRASSGYIGDAPASTITSTYKGLRIGDRVLLTSSLSSGSIQFLRPIAGNNGSTIGALFDSGQSKLTDTNSGAGIVMGNPNGYPFIEVGWDAFNATTGDKTGPRVRMRAANEPISDDIFTGLTGPQISINGSNIGFHVGPSSYFAGIPLGTGSGNKVLGRNAEGMLRWYDPGSGGSSGVTSFEGRTGAVTLQTGDVTGLGTGWLDGSALVASSVGNGKLANSSMTIGGSTVSLGGTISSFTGSFFSSTGGVSVWYGSTASGGSLPSAANYPANTILVIL
jgi:hypothetical protein